MSFNLQDSYEAIFRSAIDGIVVIDDDNKIMSFNAGAEKLLGWKASEIEGQDVTLIIPERYREMHNAGVRRYLETKNPVVMNKPFVRLASLHKNGYEIPTNFSIACYEQGNEVFFTAILRDVTEAVEHEELKTILIKELNHRVKNTMAMVNGIISQVAKHSDSIDEFRDSLQERIMNMSKTHDLLVETNWNHTTLQDLLDVFLVGQDYVYTGPFIQLKPSIAVTMGMAINELATNAIKYGAWSTDGSVKISGHTNGDKMELVWKEEGGPVVKEPSKKGFGLVLLDRVVSGSLRGKTELKFERDGFRYEVVAPLSKDIVAL